MRGIRRWMLTGTVVLALGGVALAGVKAGSVITVRVMSAKVMSGPKFIGATAGTVSRGDQLTVKEVKGDWYRVEGAATGWIMLVITVLLSSVLIRRTFRGMFPRTR